MQNSKEIEELLERGVETIVEKDDLLKKLASGRRLRIKLGIDPTGEKIHIGRATVLWKLRKFQELGHKVVLIIGDFTAQIGDASDKNTMRKPLTPQEVSANMRHYREQIGKIIDLRKAEIRFNGQWFGKLTPAALIKLTMKFTAQQMIHRRNFQERWEQGKEIGVHELLYPIFQGYDSVAVKSDVEVGGSDQLFNLLMGREVQQMFRMEPQSVVTFQMLHGLDGEKMSTTRGNVINITDAPSDMYGKVMSVRDELIEEYFTLCTDIPADEIKKMTQAIQAGENPRDFKAMLAHAITARYWGEEKAQQAEGEFNRVFREKELPVDIPAARIEAKTLTLPELLTKLRLVSSKSEAQRLVEQGGVKIDGVVQKEWGKSIAISSGMVVQVGKRKFARVL